MTKKLTIGIKALNEERHISSTIASALEAARPWAGEVILADSGSHDQTIEIAKLFPVRVFQLANRLDASCGAGAQLAFQHARSQYFYLLDGDMLLDSAFLTYAIEYLDCDHAAAAVGGFLREMNPEGHEVRIRMNESKGPEHRRAGIVDRLDGGGLYRVSAIHEVGYFADRNLHSFEEFELAARLRSKGWKLVRLDKRAIDHFAHEIGGYRLLWRRIISGYASGLGEVLRSAVGQPQFPIVLHDLKHIRHSAMVVAWWILLPLCIAAPNHYMMPSILVLFAVPIVALCIRRGSVNLGVYSFLAWNISAWGLLYGFLRRRVSPNQPLESIELSRPEQNRRTSDSKLS